MKRRKFIGLIGSAAAWPLVASAQQPERIRTVSLLVAGAPDDPEYQDRTRAFLQALNQLGWTDGRNLRIDIRWVTTDPDALRKQATELAAFAPDVILSATGTTTTAPLLEATRTLPIVFALLIDPVGAGYVSSLA